jgi:peptide/nickel transport system permease protein
MRGLAARLGRRRGALLGGGTIVLLAVAALLAPLLAPSDPDRMDLRARLRPPGPTHLLGTDGYGRDQLSRLLHGARVSLLVGVVAVAIAGTVGGGIGLLAGYLGGRTDHLLMRLVDMIMVFPTLLLAIAFLAMLGGRYGGLLNLMLAAGVASAPHFARLVRAQVLYVRELDYVEAARALGGSARRVLLRHVLLNAASPLVVFATLRIATVILTEASLSFLGFGVQAPTATWGGMVAEGTRYLQHAPWLAFVPGLAIMATVLAFNLFGDALRDALDPRLDTVRRGADAASTRRG